MRTERHVCLYNVQSVEPENKTVSCLNTVINLLSCLCIQRLVPYSTRKDFVKQTSAECAHKY